MADNYLERKMEEYRASATQRRGSALPSKGKVSFNLPPKRVIVCGPNDALSKALIKAFAEAGCRVSLYIADSSDKVTDTGGARLIKSTGVPSDDLSNVLQSWGDADVIISNQTTDTIPEIVDTVLKHRLTLPYPNDYGLRVITIGTNVPVRLPDSITCNTIMPALTDNNVILRQVALTSLFLSVPEMSALNHSILKIN